MHMIIILKGYVLVLDVGPPIFFLYPFFLIDCVLGGLFLSILIMGLVPHRLYVGFQSWYSLLPLLHVVSLYMCM